jgi:DNA uptake protein ComE-like DNA-binding protein
MNNFKSHFLFDKRKRRGILLLGALIIGVLTVLLWYTPQKDIIISDTEKERVAHLQMQVDSLKQLALAAKQPKIYPFNPNFITDYRGYTLGMSIEEMDRLQRFRKSDKWINSVSDFKEVTQVSDSLLDAISPYFKFPAWVTNPRPKKTYTSKKKWKTYEEKGKLNSLTPDALMAIDGVDKTAAYKIIAHQKKVKGYLVDQQIYDVYGVSTKIKRAILNEYTVKEKPTVILLNVNTTNASDLSTIPLLSFDMAKDIVDYRILREGIKSLEELKNLDGMTEYKFERIKLYLRAN